jgi:hypothetical protein
MALDGTYLNKYLKKDWHLMEHIHNNLMKIGGSLGKVPQKLKKNML